MFDTLTAYLQHWNDNHPDEIWLRDRQGDEFSDWSWSQSHGEVQALAAALEQRFPQRAVNIGILSRNRAHWVMTDLGIAASGNVVIPMLRSGR